MYFTEKNNSFSMFTQMLFISLYLGIFNIYIGFSIKPYMLFTLLNIVLLARHMKYIRLLIFEWFMIFFILFYSSTALNFNYPAAQLRFIFTFIIILIFYFSTRGLLETCSLENVERMIMNSGLIGVIASLIYYVMGIIVSGMNYSPRNISYYGLMIDRSIPRLIGTTSNDPNISAFFITLYFFYSLSNLKSKKNIIGSILSSIFIILTFSRGAYVSILIGMIILLIISKDRKEKYKTLIIVIVVLLFTVNFARAFFVNPAEFIEERFLSIISDGGSGRRILWSYTFDAFLNNPIFGIGINSMLEYGKINYGSTNYAHNVMLEVLAESGLIGFFLYFIFLISVFYFCIKLLKKNNDTKFIFVTFMAMILQMLFLSILYNEAFYFMLLLIYKYSQTYLNEGNKI